MTLRLGGESVDSVKALSSIPVDALWNGLTDELARWLM